MSAATPRSSTPKAARPPAAGKSARSQVKGSTLSWLGMHALGCGVLVSMLLHIALVMLHFVAPEGGVKKHEDDGKMHVLVNARMKKPPTKAQALAQANLEGGGEQIDPKHMPTSPLPPQDAVREGEALVNSSQRVRELEARQRELLALAQGGKTRVAPERVQQSVESPVDTATEERGLDMTKAAAIARQEAVIDKLVKDYALRPRKNFIMPSTRESKSVMYSEAALAKVIRVGELNFPRNAKGSLYGSVQVAFEIRPDGSLASAEVTRPNPDSKINEAALRIIRLAAPYARIPDEMRKEYDVVVIVRTLSFTREDISAQ